MNVNQLIIVREVMEKKFGNKVFEVAQMMKIEKKY